MSNKIIDFLLNFFIRLFFSKRPIILLYHDVFSVDNIYSDSVTTDGFNSQIRFLSKYFNICTLDDFEKVKDINRSFIERPSVLITFDDGYENNFSNAYPIIKFYKSPIVIFANSLHIDSNKLLWFKVYKIYNILGLYHNNITSIKERMNQPSSLYDNKFHELEVGLKCFWDLKDFAEYTSGLKSFQIVEMHSSGLVEFGLHTHSHPIVSQVKDTVTLEHEWHYNYYYLKNIINNIIVSAAYPNGMFDLRNISILEKMGIKYCFSVDKTIKSASRNFQYLRTGIYSDSFFKFFIKLFLHGKI